MILSAFLSINLSAQNVKKVYVKVIDTSGIGGSVADTNYIVGQLDIIRGELADTAALLRSDISDSLANMVTDNIYIADGTLTGDREIVSDGYDLSFTGTGNVGIGTSSPSAKLHVSGGGQFRTTHNSGHYTDIDGRYVTNIGIGQSSSIRSYNYHNSKNVGASFLGYKLGYSNGVDAILQENDHKLLRLEAGAYTGSDGKTGGSLTFYNSGIWTTSQRPTRFEIDLANNSNVTNSVFQIESDGEIILPEYGALNFSGNNANLLGASANGNIVEITDISLDGTGKVGIGTASPSNTLHVNSDGVNTTANFQSTDANANIGFTDNTTTALTGIGANGDQLRLYAGGNARAYISNSGNVGIGTSTPSVEFDVIGDIEYTGTITDVSDERLKENFLPIDSALQKVIAINPTLFTMKGSDRVESGYKAQNVQEHFSHVVKEVDEAGTLGLDYTQMISLLHQAIKDQQALIDSLEARIEELENQ